MLELIMYCIDYSDDENMGTSNDAQTELREDLLSLKNKVGQIQKDLINGKFIEKVKIEVNGIKDRLNEIKKSSEHSNIFISEFKEKIGELEARFLELQMEINKNTAKNVDPRSLIKESLKLIKASEKKIEDLDVKIKGIEVLQKNLNQLEDRLSDFFQKNEKVESKVYNNLQNINIEMTNTKKFLANLDKGLKDNNKTMNEYHVKSINQLQEVNKQIFIVFERVNAQDDLINGLLETKENDKMTIEKMQLFIKELKDEISSSNFKIDKLVKEVNMMRSEKNSNRMSDITNDKNTEEIHILTDNINDLRKKVDDLITLPNWLTNQLKTLEKSLIEKSRTLCTDMINTTHKQVMTMQTKIEDQTNDIYSLSRKSLEEFRNELTILKTQSSTKHTDYNKIEVYENVLNSLSKRIDALESIQSEDKSRYQITSYIKEIRGILNNINLFHMLFQKHVSIKEDQKITVDITPQKQIDNVNNGKPINSVKTSRVKVDQQTKSNESDKGEKTSVESSFDNKRTKTKDKDGNESASKPLNKPKAPIKEKEESSKKSQSSTTSKATESSKSSKYNPKKNLLI